MFFFRCSFQPAILNLPPNYPDAKIFKEADPDSTSPSTSSPPSFSFRWGLSSDSKANASGNDGTKLKLFESRNLVVLMALIAWMFF